MNPTRRAALLAACLPFTLGACSVASVVNALVPTDTLEIRRDLAYGSHPRQQLDVYRRSAEPGAAARPVVVFFYGGSWQHGSRSQYLFAAEALASLGFLVVVPDYRVYPEVVFPAFLDDGARAVAWARSHAAEFGGDPARLFLMGHSAGAHIAAMIALDPQYLAGAGMRTKDLAGFIGLAGPYDFLPLESEVLRKIFVPPERLASTQPINFVRGDDPPALLITGEEDALVNPGNTARLAARLRQHGSPVEERRYAGFNHYTLVGYLAAPLRDERLLRDIARFAGLAP